jgi:MoxR-like ATPase
MPSMSSRSTSPSAHADSLRAAQIKARFDQAVEVAGRIILGKERQIRLAYAGLLARGHLLIEDMPGVGKTTLAHVLARTLGLQFSRIQFTSDMLPADILGVSIYNREGGFVFHPGPVFAQVILADEINRATPKTQSALLEAMEEHQVTLEGETHALPKPFFVIATQNPSYQIGTFPLPESQLDRFMLRISLGYPDQQAERALLKGRDRRDLLEDVAPCIAPDELISMQRQVSEVHVADALLDYVQKLLDHSRRHAAFAGGLSPRAGLAWLHCARAWALLEGRDHVLPDDVRIVLPHVVGHRLKAADERADTASLIAQLSQIPIP